MISTMYLGSADTNALLMGKNTKGHAQLMQRFVSGEKPYYNAFNSPIDACRAGAILEERMIAHLGSEWLPQYRVECEEMNVLRSTLDFTKLDKGEIVDFIELKSINFDDYLKIPLKGRLDFVKKKYKQYYRQVQQQLLCTGLNEATLRFLCVYSYDDSENWQRVINDNDYTDVRIIRDDKVIKQIKERASIFQTIKDFYDI